MFRRLIAALLILGLALALLLAAWPQLLGLQYFPVVAQVVSLRAAAAVGAVGLVIVILVLAIAIRPFRRLGASLAALLIVFVAVNAAVLADRGFDLTQLDEAQDGEITVLSWNTLGDATGSQAIADLAIETGADIVSLPETTNATAFEVAEIMREAGRPMWVNYLALDAISKARSTSLLTSADLGTYSRDSSRGTTSVVPSVIATPDDGTGPTIIAAHPVAPIPGYLDTWHDDLLWLKAACTGEDIIMAGDLNSTLDHYGPLANDADSSIGDCADAAKATGTAAIGTWPTRIPAVLGSPIDHIMATDNWKATSVEVIRDREGAGSDHRPIVARLTPVG